MLSGLLCCFRLVHAAECPQACCVASGLWEAAQPICSSGDAAERWLVAAPRAAGPHQGPTHRDLPFTCSGAHLPARPVLPFPLFDDRQTLLLHGLTSGILPFTCFDARQALLL